jgi:hypothetical protein
MRDLIYELVIEDSADEIYAISLVSEPAIEMDFVYFDKEEVKFSTVSEEQRIVMGPILVPDKKILRIDGEGKPYYVFIKAATIQKLAQKYLQNKYQSEVTIEHNGKRVADVTLIESWITESRTKDKSAVYGLSVPVGTWMGSMKIESDKIWNEFVKTGIVNGFSIEGLFSHQLVEQSKEELYLQKEISDLTEDEAKKVLSAIESILSNGVELAEPSVASTYPGEAASGSIAPATFAEASCPESTQNIKVNIEHRQKAINEAKYGPLNPNEPNEDYWKAKADQFKGNVEEAKKALCGNCAFFYRTPEILKCIADGLGMGVDPYEAIKAGEIGYCEAYDFKCAASRTCDAWVVGGPITQ